MRFLFYKTNNPTSREQFNRIMDRIWNDLPNGRVLAEFGKLGSLRQFYFGFIVDEVARETGDDPASLHNEFKRRFSDGESVFSRNTTLTVQQQEDFVNQVRHFVLHRLNVKTEAWRNKD